MSCKMTKKAYIEICNEDIAWLKSVSDSEHSLEMQHIIQIIEGSVACYYPEPKE